MNLSKWTELQALIDDAMVNKVPISEIPRVNDDCVVRDTKFNEFDTGFRRARLIGKVSNLFLFTYFTRYKICF